MSRPPLAADTVADQAIAETLAARGHGPVIARRDVAVAPGDTAASLAAHIQTLEPSFFVETLRRIATGELKLEGLENGS